MNVWKTDVKTVGVIPADYVNAITGGAADWESRSASISTPSTGPWTTRDKPIREKRAQFIRSFAHAQFRRPARYDTLVEAALIAMATSRTFMVIKNINKCTAVRRMEKRLRRLQRKASRKYEMNKEGTRFVKTCNLVKVEKSIRLLRRRIANIRTNHIHQATSTIAKTKPGAVVMEDLNVSGMMKNRHLSKSIAGQKLHEFSRQMKYKCEKIGAKFVQAAKGFPSSKLCSCCGQIKTDLKLSDRLYECNCGLKMDRDMNAAINLSKLAMQHRNAYANMWDSLHPNLRL